MMTGRKSRNQTGYIWHWRGKKKGIQRRIKKKTKERTKLTATREGTPF